MQGPIDRPCVPITIQEPGFRDRLRTSESRDTISITSQPPAPLPDSSELLGDASSNAEGRCSTIREKEMSFPTENPRHRRQWRIGKSPAAFAGNDLTRSTGKSAVISFSIPARAAAASRSPGSAPFAPVSQRRAVSEDPRIFLRPSTTHGEEEKPICLQRAQPVREKHQSSVALHRRLENESVAIPTHRLSRGTALPSDW